MTVTEMYAVLRERMDDAVLPYERDDEVLFQWLQQAYLRIQHQSHYWSFLHNRGLIFSSVANTASYSLPAIREIDLGTTYVVQDGSTVRTPLYKGDYRFWAEEERNGVITPSQPQLLIKGPNSTWILYPTPSAIWHVYGDSWAQPDLFDDGASEPIWDADLHSLVWMVAAVSTIPGTELKLFAESTLAEISSSIPGMMQEMRRRYLSDFRGLC